jgi:hypothetical protein
MRQKFYARVGLTLVGFEVERQFAVGREYLAW